MDWIKKNVVVIVLNLLSLIVVSTVGFSVNRVVNEIDSKATKEEVQREMNYVKTNYIHKSNIDSLVGPRIENAIGVHETREQIIINGVKDAILIGNKNIEKILNIHIKNVDDRLSRLENKY